MKSTFCSFLSGSLQRSQVLVTDLKVISGTIVGFPHRLPDKQPHGFSVVLQKKKNSVQIRLNVDRWTNSASLTQEILIYTAAITIVSSFNSWWNISRRTRFTGNRLVTWLGIKGATWQAESLWNKDEEGSPTPPAVKDCARKRFNNHVSQRKMTKKNLLSLFTVHNITGFRESEEISVHKEQGWKPTRLTVIFRPALNQKQAGFCRGRHCVSRWTLSKIIVREDSSAASTNDSWNSSMQRGNYRNQF